METPAQVSIREGIRSLAAGLTDPDADHRQLVVQHILSQCIPEVQSLIVDNLLEIVKDGGPDAGPAVASLAQFGNCALPALTHELVKSRNGAIQLRVVQALATVAQKLPTSECVDLMFFLTSAYRFAVDDKVRTAIARLLARLRRRR